MALQRISQFRESFAEGSRPTLKTVIRWIENHQLYGRKFGGVYYVDPDRDPEPESTSEPAPDNLTPGAMGLVNQVLTNGQ